MNSSVNSRSSHHSAQCSRTAALAGTLLVGCGGALEDEEQNASPSVVPGTPYETLIPTQPKRCIQVTPTIGTTARMVATGACSAFVASRPFATRLASNPSLCLSANSLGRLDVELCNQGLHNFNHYVVSAVPYRVRIVDKITGKCASWTTGGALLLVPCVDPTPLSQQFE